MPGESVKTKITNFLCQNQAIDLLLADSSDEEVEAVERFSMNMICLLANRRSVHLSIPKSLEWQRNVLKNIDDGRFSQMIRVKPEELRYIVELIKQDEVFNTSSSATQLSIELQLKIVLFRLGSSGDGFLKWLHYLVLAMEVLLKI
ncbi:uncharacterized protein LOC118734927 [Rhagoletis pomonella]|uniref:uncharacterized protein LOC118734927 n=1 Tax=Rhagoletis pomonella TaxID=28610 RepID=UPI0017800815|nr:uncharacterized protein LOC118734927 [Rhagoletis pomonella]